jgi:type IV pilus assembly protein PilC
MASFQDHIAYTRQLATLIHAGVPLLQAFDILHRCERNTSSKAIIGSLHKQIEAGTALNQALRQHPEFDTLYCNLIAVGELAGMFDTMLERLANHLEKSEALRVSIRSALVYPCAVLGIAAVVLVLILAFFVPAFQNIFASFGAELPWLTRCVITLSEGLQHHGLWVLASLCIAAWWLQKQFQQREQWRRFLHGLLLRIPIAGPLTQHACMHDGHAL